MGNCAVDLSGWLVALFESNIITVRNAWTLFCLAIHTADRASLEFFSKQKTRLSGCAEWIRAHILQTKVRRIDGRAFIEVKPKTDSPFHWSQIRQEYPLNLSILISGGKETNKDSPSNGEWSGKSSNLKSHRFPVRIVIWRVVFEGSSSTSPLEQGIIEGENPVFGSRSFLMWYDFKESVCLGMQTKMGGKYHLRLNTGERPIANKYREGKMKRTLKRELNSTWNC